MKKLLYILHGWPPESLGGTEIYARRLAKHLSGKFQVGVFCRTSDPARRPMDVIPVEDGHVTITGINAGGPADSFVSTYNVDGMAHIFEEYLDREGAPDLAHIHHLGGIGHSVASVLERRSIPFVVTFHDFAFTCPRGQRLRDNLAICRGLSTALCVECLKPQCKSAGVGIAGKIYRHIFRKREGAALMESFWKSSESVANAAAVLIAPSRHHATVMERDGFAGDKIRVMPYGYDKEYFNRYDRSEIGLARKFGFIGSLIPSKGPHLIIEAQKRLRREYPDLPIETHFYGPAPAYHGRCDYGDMLSKQASGLEATFHGPVDPDEIGEVLVGLDAVIVPSLWWESHGMVVREAKMAGLPVIVSGHGALAESVRDGVNGMLFRPGNARALRDKMLILARTGGLADAIAKGEMDILDIHEDAARHAALYNEVLGG